MKSTQIAFLAVLTILSGCGIQYHQKKIGKHTDKLISKGVLIPKDTLYVTKSDTVVKTFVRNDTTFVEYTIRDTVTLEPQLIVKDRWQVRTETKWKYKTIKVQEKTKAVEAKQKTKQTRSENRKSRWWLWLLIGITIGYILQPLLKVLGVYRNLPKI